MHYFYSVDEFLMFKQKYLCKDFLSPYSITYLLCMYGFSITFVYFVQKLHFRCNVYNVLNMYMSVQVPA
jgi:hypothetical protein